MTIHLSPCTHHDRDTFTIAHEIDSTSLKYASHSRDRGGSTAGPWPTETWYSRFHSFHNDFFDDLRQGYRARTRHKLREEDPIDIWKSLGDEIIFVQNLHSYESLYFGVLAFRESLRGYLEEGKRITFKGCVWLGQFPVVDREIPIGSGREYDLDFIGPSIDRGFRIASEASQQRLIISVDAAYALARLYNDEYPKGSSGLFARERQALKLYYMGEQTLKGVTLLHGRGYPIFWAGVTATPGDSLIAPTDSREVERYARAFYDGQNWAFRIPPENLSPEHLYSEWGDEISETRDTEVFLVDGRIDAEVSDQQGRSEADVERASDNVE